MCRSFTLLIPTHGINMGIAKKYVLSNEKLRGVEYKLFVKQGNEIGKENMSLIES